MELVAWFEQTRFWHWFILAFLLVGFEMLVPGTYLLWLGISAGVVGVVVLVLPDLAWQVQLALFAIVSVAAVVASRIWIRRHPIETEQPALNRRGEQYVGRTFTLTEPVSNGEGRLRVDDTTWKVRGEDVEAGARVRVTGADGTVLKIEPV
ncbi:MAG: NfeD family protein [Alphaproteobacteria bacterium]|nr:NfeD family protein [Alphaproteobacteria bacterium]